MKYQQIQEALISLASVDMDYAQERNGVGFNGVDSSFGHNLAEAENLTFNQASAAYKMLRKYKNQLSEYSIDYSSISEPIEEIQIDEEDNGNNIENYLSEISWSDPKEVFTKNGKKNVQNSEIPSKWWDYWKSHKEEIKSKGISCSKNQYGEWQLAKWSDVESEIEKFKLEDIKLQYESLLLSYQKDHVKKLITSIKNFDAAIDASSTGTGKTYSSCMVAKELNLFPIVVTPKAVIPSFEKVMKNHFQIDGFVSNYEQYKTGNTQYVKKEYIINRKSKKDEKFIWQNLPNNAIIIFDEVHRCKNYKTQNAKLLIAAKEQKLRIMVMSATIGSNPLHLYAVGRVLNLFSNTYQFLQWAKRHGCYAGNWGGYEFNNSKEALQKIHDQIYPKRGSRIRISELGDKFPETLIISDAYDMNSNANKIQNAYDKMKIQLEDIKKKEKEDSENQLTVLLRARQKIELLKVPTLIELAEDHFEEGNNVAIFVNFDETAKSISEKLNNAPMIWGKNKGNERQEIVEDFQNNKIPFVICNIRSGGIGISLHDEKNQKTRVSLISPSWSAEDLLQALGRVHRAGGGKSIQKIIFCANTVEEDISIRVNEKISNINMLNDGDLNNF